uniref:Uncharacterized protein n=1 Tax=Anopheles culicifacies TaxID=139723 RepID=A0A182M1M9_9DIPT
MWKGFDQLLVSPSIGHKRINRRQQRSRSTKNDSIANIREQEDGWQIDDYSDDDTAVSSRHESDTLLSTITPSVPQSLNPAEVTIDRRNQSDSEVEHISEDDCRPRSDTTSESSDSDDCLAIHCTKSRMTRLQFVDKKSIKRRRITDDMDVSFVASSSRAKNRSFNDAVSPKRFKSVSTLNRSTATAGLNNSVTDTTVADRSARCWKSFDASFTDLEESFIEDLPSSPESANNGQRSCAEPIYIEELPSSVEESSCRNSLPQSSTTTPPSKSFYVTSPGATSKRLNHPISSPMGALAVVLNDRSSQQHRWQHAIMSGRVQPALVVKLDSIERIFGRVMLRFFTTTSEADDCIQERIENIIFLDQSDKQLKSIHAGMEIALEVDEQIAPHRVSHNKLVHLGVTKLGRFHRGGGSSFLGVLALVLVERCQTALRTAIQDLLAILVHLQFHDHTLGRVHTDVHVRAVCLLALDALNVHDVLLAVHLNHLAHLITLVVTAHYLHFVILANWHGTSFESGADMIFLRMCDGAWKWRLRLLRRDDETCLFNFIFIRG